MTEEGKPIHILVADDHPVVLDGLVAMLNTQSDFEVVAQAATAQETLNLENEHHPDILMLDLEMPDMDGVAVLEELHGRHSPVRVIVFTAFDTDERILAAVKAGARGYILKGAPREEIFSAIRVVNSGGSLLGSLVASSLIQHVQNITQKEKPLYEELTPREMEVLALLAKGMTNKKIAAELVISERTAKFHVSAILSKLGAGNRTEAVSMAAQLGLIEL
jgi:NarL family two-component system response regulator LiaR